jgi:hypothetical protein
MAQYPSRLIVQFKPGAIVVRAQMRSTTGTYFTKAKSGATLEGLSKEDRHKAVATVISSVYDNFR